MGESKRAALRNVERLIFGASIAAFAIAMVIGVATALHGSHRLPWASLNHLVMARQLRAAGDVDGAIAEYEAAHRVDMTNPRAGMTLASLLSGTGRPGAIEALALVSASSLESTVHLEYARKAAQLGRFDELEIAIRRAETYSPGTADVWLAVGEINESVARPRAAFEAYSMALEIDPGSALARAALQRLEARGLDSDRDRSQEVDR